MFLGRYKKGDWLPLSVQCRDNLAVVAPDAAPEISIYSPAFSKVFGPRSIPPRASGRRTGLFEIEQFLGSEFSVGIYNVIVTYAKSPNFFADLLSFEVVPSGHQDGSYINLYFYERPHADYVVGQLDADILEFRKNPVAADG
jgi:hypothetical protein